MSNEFKELRRCAHIVAFQNVRNLFLLDGDEDAERDNMQMSTAWMRRK